MGGGLGVQAARVRAVIQVVCDNCSKAGGPRPDLTLTGQVQTNRGGILLPVYERHFCTGRCLRLFLEDVEVKT